MVIIKFIMTKDQKYLSGIAIFACVPLMLLLIPWDLFSKKRIIETLNNPISVVRSTESGIVLSNGQTLQLLDSKHFHYNLPVYEKPRSVASK